MPSAAEYARRFAGRKRFTEEGMQADTAEHKNVSRTGSDRPAPGSKTDFAALPNRTERPEWASNR